MVNLQEIISMARRGDREPPPAKGGVTLDSKRVSNMMRAAGGKIARRRRKYGNASASSGRAFPMSPEDPDYEWKVDLDIADADLAVLNKPPNERKVESVLAIVDKLEAEPFFSSIPRENLVQLCTMGRLQTFRRHEVICRQGDPSTSMFVILGGSVGVRVQYTRLGERTSQLAYKLLKEVEAELVTLRNASKVEDLLLRHFGGQVMELGA
eukprot:CAMPEP_0182910010 /NCGR_PEP_ID=MMETSP0034_2-20130328/36070_1 /TAXON_ID=156128 /ORGANISM="Nephroselmis pyriformis, Strain CCMP717" /LENGTH=209 /DNA_ID=CAMNT_0025046303 /DNA_START=100 /DNA_END=725 /DNA_ORIENTATION=-